jgi:hypothetical protein
LVKLEDNITKLDYRIFWGDKTYNKPFTKADRCDIVRKLCILKQFKPKMTLKKRSKNHQKTVQIVAVILFQKMGLETTIKNKFKGLSVKNVHTVFNHPKDQLKKLQN